VLGRLRVSTTEKRETEKVRGKNVTAERKCGLFPQNSCIYSYYVFFRDSAIWKDTHCGTSSKNIRTCNDKMHTKKRKKW